MKCWVDYCDSQRIGSQRTESHRLLHQAPMSWMSEQVLLDHLWLELWALLALWDNRFPLHPLLQQITTWLVSHFKNFTTLIIPLLDVQKQFNLFVDSFMFISTGKEKKRGLFSWEMHTINFEVLLGDFILKFCHCSPFDVFFKLNSYTYIYG